MICKSGIRSMIVQAGSIVGAARTGAYLNSIERVCMQAASANREFKTSLRMMVDSSATQKQGSIVDVLSQKEKKGGYISGGCKSEGGKLSCGYSSFRGKRATMEDFYDIKTSKINGHTFQFQGTCFFCSSGFYYIYRKLKMLKLVRQCSVFTSRVSSVRVGLLTSVEPKRGFCSNSEESELVEYLNSLNNYEKSGVPVGAGTDSDHGFDLGRMQTLMELLGSPHYNFKAVHIAGTKGKGSTAAFLSNILRAQGYSVGCYTSPHIRTIRERITLGRSGEPVPAKALNCIFQETKTTLDRAIEVENGYISHFEVLTALAFTLFAKEKVDIAVIEAGLGGARDATNVIPSSGLAISIITTIDEEHLAALGGSLESIAMAKSGIMKHGCPVVLGGPFLPHIECILRDKARLMNSLVVLASDTRNRSNINGFSMRDGRPFQSCDIVIHLESDLKLSIELLDLKLFMLGSHQLQNAVTATCAALCLRNLGWRISDSSIRTGLQQTRLLGRSQFLTLKEAEALGLSGATILLDGAHTKESAKALMDTVKMCFPKSRLTLVIAMANDKDHLGFAKEFLSGGHVEGVICTEANIAGGKSRTTAASVLRNCWIQASKELEDIVHDQMTECQDFSEDQLIGLSKLEKRPLLAAVPSFRDSLKLANQIFRGRTGDLPHVTVITGSLHIVSLTLASLNV